MRRLVVAVFAFSLMAVFLPAATADGHIATRTNDVTRPPVSPDGLTAGEITDFVITLVDRNPAVDGVSLKEGGTVAVTLPAGFTDVDDGSANALVLLQGWPQSPPGPPPGFLWDTTVDGNTMTATVTADFLVGDFGPGFKQVHLLLNSFRNPAPGRYDVPVVIQPDPASHDTLQATARVQIGGATRPSINVVSVFSGGGPPPPFDNPLYQTIAAGDDSLDVGLYLWDAGSSVADGVLNPFIGVDIGMASPSDGVLHQGGVVVGHVHIDAPPGANGFGISTDGPSVLGTSVVTNLDVGVMVIRLHTDAAATGDYVVTLTMGHGNSQRLVVTTE